MDGCRLTAPSNKSLDASGISGLVIDNLTVTKLSPAASTQTLGGFAQREEKFNLSQGKSAAVKSKKTTMH
jgi:hypothetical protein